MRVLVVIPYYEPAFLYGGPARSVSTLCRALVRAGAEVSVFTTDANGSGRLDVPVGQPVDLGGVRVYYFRRDWRTNFFYSADLAEACLRRVGEFEVVHCNALWTYPSLPTATACRRSGVPRVESLRGGLMPWCLHHHYWKKWLFLVAVERSRLNRARAIHCTDELEREAILRLGVRSPAFIVPNPVELSEFSSLPQRGWLRARLGLGPDAAVSLFLGRLSAVKGVDRTISAFASVAARRQNAHFVIAGPDDDGSGQRGQTLVSRLGLTDRISFIGTITGADRLAALADADLFVLTSHSENFGMAAAEALAAGLPVLLSDQVGIARQVAEAGAGCVVPLDESRIAGAWSSLLGDRTALSAMGNRGRNLARQEYDADRVARKMLTVYSSVIRDWRAQH